MFLLYFNPQHPDFSEYPEFKEKKVVACYAYRHEAGVYETGFNFEYAIKEFTEFGVLGNYNYFDENGIVRVFGNSIRYGNGFYGVADNVEQIKKVYEKEIEKNPIVISITKIEKSKEPKSGGWRWHKWGPYIGIKNPQCEYIADEPEIEEVLCFHIHVLVDKNLKRGKMLND